MKKIHRFLVATIPTDTTFDIRDTRVTHQISHVLRLRPEEECILFTNNGPDTLVKILTIEKHTVTVSFIENRSSLNSATRTVIAAVSIVKGDKFELIVQKLTELGVSAIIPVISDRTIKQSLRLDRLQTIADEALEQCGGNRRVSIHEPLTLSACVEQHNIPSYVLIPNADDTPPTEKLPDTLMLYVGPEGGWTDAEEIFFIEKNISGISLGTRILRTETAAIVGVFKLLQ